MSNRKSTKLKVLEGDVQKARHKKEPTGKRNALPKPPYWLNVEARKFWRRHVKDLNEAWIYTSLDFDALADICDAEAALIQLIKIRDENPDVGNFKAVTDMQHKLRLMRNDFGLTPKARMALSVEPADEDEGIEQYFTK